MTKHKLPEPLHKTAKGNYQIGIWTVQGAKHRWEATAPGHDPQRFTSLAAAYEALTGEPRPYHDSGLGDLLDQYGLTPEQAVAYLGATPRAMRSWLGGYRAFGNPEQRLLYLVGTCPEARAALERYDRRKRKAT